MTVTEIASVADTVLEQKGEKTEINEWENGKHVTLNDMAQLVKLFMSTGIQGGLAQEEHNLVGGSGLCQYKRKS